MSSHATAQRRRPRSLLVAAAVTVALSTAIGGPALAAVPDGSGPVLDLALQVDRDGHGPFTPRDGPGSDSGDRNGMVRTWDAVTYAVSISANGAAATNETVTLTAPAGTTWAPLPTVCTGPGSQVHGAELVCNVGDLAEGSARTVPAILDVGGSVPNGRVLAVRGTVTADGTDAPVERTSAPVTVSAAPRYDLSATADVPLVEPDVTGPDGTTPGIAIEYPITLHWSAPVDGQGIMGAERSTGSFAFEDDLSRMHGDAVSRVELLGRDGRPTCGPNTTAHFRKLPDGAGGGTSAVTDSGRFTCSQERPGGPVTVRIDGADTALSPTTIPTENGQGSPVQGGVKPYVVVGYVSLWMPRPPTTESFIATNRFSPVRTTSISGAANYPDDAEPLANNVADRNIASFLTGGGYKAISRVDADGRLSEGSARAGDPYITANDVVASTVEITNPGLSPYRRAITCDVFDERALAVTRFRGEYARTSGFTDPRIQYAARAFDDPTAARDATCDDGDATWYDSPDEVPGGLGAVGMVRASGDVRAGGAASLRVWLRTQSAPNATRAFNFGQLYFGDDGDGEWQHDRFDADLGAGGLADSVIITADVARITKRVVDPGSDATDTPDATSAVTAGTTVEYGLYPTLTNPGEGANPTDVTVADDLPPRTTYVPGSASIEPSAVDDVTDGSGTVHQRLRWDLTGVTPDTAIAPVTYSARVSRLAPPGPIENTATVATPGDASPLGLRTAVRGLDVVTDGALAVEKRAVEPTVVVGDALRWELEYANTGPEPIAGPVLIDVLPSSGHGSDGDARLVEPVPEDPATTTTVRYTAADPGAVSLDADDPSNRPGGATRWCSTAEFGATGCPDAVESATALRIGRGLPVDPGASVLHELTLEAAAPSDRDAFVNRFGLRSTTIPLPVISNPATVTVVSGSIGDQVWFDTDDDGLRDAGEPGAPGFGLALAGTDDRGAHVHATTTSDEHGRYRFAALRPGTYTVSIDAGPRYRPTTWRAGDDPAVDSDFHQDGTSSPVTLVVEQDPAGSVLDVSDDPTVDAGLVTDGAVVPPEVPEAPTPPAVPDAGRGDGAGGAGGGAAGSLAWTGTDLSGALLAATVLLLGGAGLVVSTRRRRR